MLQNQVLNFESNSSSARVAMLMPYFGKFPPWMDLYLWSCSKNEMVDFIFITDCEIPEVLYNNTFFVKMSFDAYCQLVSETLNISFHPQGAYKVCDLRPFFGIIHRNLIKKYDFYGYGDLDLIYGDLSSLVNDKNLDKYDLITPLIAYIAGHFTLIKKDSQYTELAFRIADWRRKLEDSRHYTLDEVDYTQLLRPSFGYRLADILWYHGGKMLFKDRTRFYKHVRAMTGNTVPALMEDWCTTFTPIKGEVYKFNLSTREFFIPGKVECGKVRRLNRWVYLPYIHFYEFKHSLANRESPTWTGDFYQIPKNHSFSEDDEVEFTTKWIRLSSS